MDMKSALKIFKALADPTRLRILLLLRARRLCVCELVFVLKMEQSRVSHQLRVLREAGLVEDEREGRWIVYRVPAGRGALLDRLLEESGGGPGRGAAPAEDARRLGRCVREGIRTQACPPKAPRPRRIEAVAAPRR